jgi:cytidine deaminase
MPCGACRQFMAEFMTPEATVEVDGVGAFPLGELLPRPFRLERGGG